MAAAEADVRHRILDAISAKPGIHMRELQRSVGVSLSAISHHLHALEVEGAIVGVSDRHYRRYFLSTLVLPQESRRLNDSDRRLLLECQRPMSLAIILNLAVDEPLPYGEFCRRLSRSKGTVSYHLSRLLGAGLVRVAIGSATEAYELCDRVHTMAVLVTFAGTLRDHADGLARLWLSLSEQA